MTKHDCCMDGVASHLSKNGGSAGGDNFYYTCPMHLEIRQDRPGICPECGMNLAQTKDSGPKTEDADFDKHAGHKTQNFLKKFWISLILSIPVVAYSEILKELFGWQAAPRLLREFCSGQPWRRFLCR